MMFDILEKCLSAGEGLKRLSQKFNSFVCLFGCLFTKFWREIYKGIKKTAWRHIAELLINLFTKRGLGLVLIF